jgi:hypothetical protein
MAEECQQIQPYSDPYEYEHNLKSIFAQVRIL